MHQSIQFWNSCDKTNNWTLFSKKSEHVSIFDSVGTLEINGGSNSIQALCPQGEQPTIVIFHAQRYCNSGSKNTENNDLADQMLHGKRSTRKKSSD